MQPHNRRNRAAGRLTNLSDPAPRVREDHSTEAPLGATGGSRRLLTAWSDLWASLFRTRRNPIRPGRFWCDEHWNYMMNSRENDNPIDHNIATMAIVSALVLKFGEPDSPYIEACCQLPDDILWGIFERSRGWIQKRY